MRSSHSPVDPYGNPWQADCDGGQDAEVDE
jgi:hypothetical protein